MKEITDILCQFQSQKSEKLKICLRFSDEMNVCDLLCCPIAYALCETSQKENCQAFSQSIKQFYSCLENCNKVSQQGFNLGGK